MPIITLSSVTAGEHINNFSGNNVFSQILCLQSLMSLCFLSFCSYFFFLLYLFHPIERFSCKPEPHLQYGTVQYQCVHIASYHKDTTIQPVSS